MGGRGGEVRWAWRLCMGGVGWGWAGGGGDAWAGEGVGKECVTVCCLQPFPTAASTLPDPKGPTHASQGANTFT